MRLAKILPLILFPFVSFSQTNKPMTPVQKVEQAYLNDTTYQKDELNHEIMNIVIHSPKGLVIAQGSLKNNKREGTWREYNNQGMFTTITEYHIGMKHGASVHFGNNNNLMDDETYSKDSLNGPKITYNNGGKIKVTEHYVNGVLDGDKKAYYDNGKVQEESTYINGQRNGMAKWYFQTGTPSIEYNYKMGELNGASKEYFSNGLISKEGNYLKDAEDGEWKIYNDSILVKKIIYKNGVTIKEQEINKEKK